MMELTLLGTGNPAPDPKRAGPSQLVRIGTEKILVACGNGAMQRLVHEAWLKPETEPARERMPPEQAEEWIRRRDRYHTDSHDVGKIAAQADPRLLVLSHLGNIDTDVMASHVSADFDRFVVGADLMTFDVGGAALRD